ncbi:SIMPL domain-containing protein [Candidatus Villigracilis affinis]|uniref:SIMPL domain-containing protein n=1 Tax=Candidatus Villigracilis affinis TaxID=3140682 RepID=UPI002A22A1C2|nr:SIMPL domain-containing protein [Anaerolineales bacterium]
MMNQEQLIKTPFGINVFGSALIRVDPDVVSLNFSVSRLHQHPKEAFQDVRKASQGVRKYLEQAKVGEVGTSRVNISQTFRYISNENKFVGYTARVSFHVLLRQLDSMEDVLSGIVDAGVNEITSVDFQTTRLKEIRAEARRRAINAAREKAENYCTAAQVSLGKVIHIEDVNPDTLRGREGHVSYEIQPDDSGEIKVFDPGSITVGAAVIIAFKIE